MLRPLCSFLLILTACNIQKLTVNTTSKVLAKAQPSMKQESDYEMAARAIPASLKTVEGFHMVDPENQTLVKILAEGYCQYATGFIEDEWELATFATNWSNGPTIAFSQSPPSISRP